MANGCSSLGPTLYPAASQGAAEPDRKCDGGGFLDWQDQVSLLRHSKWLFHETFSSLLGMDASVMNQSSCEKSSGSDGSSTV